MLDFVDFNVFFWLIVMFYLHALVVKRHVWVLYFPVWLVRNCGKILKLVPFNIVYFLGGGGGGFEIVFSIESTRM